MHPEMRRQFAVKLASKAEVMGYPLDGRIKEAGAADYASLGHLRSSVEMRKVACPPGEDREFLDELLEKKAHLSPDIYAECLHQFDVHSGLDKGWGWQYYLLASSMHAFNNYAAVLFQSKLITVVQVEIYAGVVAALLTGGVLWLRWRKSEETVD